MKNNKWVHIIGIAGVTTSALAIEFKNIGWDVTGSDSNIYSPVDKILEDKQIKVFGEYSYKNLLNEFGGKPDLVIMGSSKALRNKEYLFAKKNQLTVKNYPQVLTDFVVAEKSIVVTGTYGKTSISLMLTHVLKRFEEKLSYMVGGFSESLSKTLQFKSETTKTSVIEGDEYISAKDDKKSKFFYYNPNILIINSIEWDHTDVFKTESDYIQNFSNLISQIPTNGKIFASKSKNILEALKAAKCEVEFFEDEKFFLETDLVGDFNKSNIAHAHQILISMGYESSKVQKYLKEFKGVNRRLEVKYKDENSVLIDDFGSSPAKAKRAIQTVKKEFKNSNLIVIYEPNEGARTEESKEMYQNLFDGVDSLILPKFREMKDRLDSHELAQIINKSFPKKLIESNDLVKDILNLQSSEMRNVILFLGSHSFEKEINQLEELLTKE